jgi:hypothetical protein
MSVGLISEMAKSVFQPLNQRLDKAGPNGKISPDEIRDLLAGCGMGTEILDHLSKTFHEILRRGVEKNKLRLLQREFLEIVGLAGNEIYPRVHAHIATDALPEEERAAAKKTLEKYTERVRLIGEELKSLEAWLERPRPPLDTSAFGPTPANDYSAYEDSKDIEARIKSGEGF